MPTEPPAQLDSDVLCTIWKVHHLGDIHTAEKPDRGVVNPCWVVNDAQVIRFDVRASEVSRFESEAIAYQRLAGSGVPVPEVVALDLSKEIVPYDYLITSKLPGTPVVDSWADLTGAQKTNVAREAGAYLAAIHATAFDHIGKLRQMHWGGFDTWYAYVQDYTRRYIALALERAVFTTETAARIEAVLAKLRPLLERITQGFLVHSDYHFENILQQEGQVTGIIDFEWAYSGDPSSDFAAQFRWEQMCPGSTDPLLAGYTSQRPLDPDHETRRHLYTLLLHVETVAAWTDQMTDAAIAEANQLLFEELRWLEG